MAKSLSRVDQRQVLRWGQDVAAVVYPLPSPSGVVGRPQRPHGEPRRLADRRKCILKTLTDTYTLHEEGDRQ